MATIGHNLEEKHVGATQLTSESPVNEKHDAIHEETAHEAAERGHVATDK